MKNSKAKRKQPNTRAALFRHAARLLPRLQHYTSFTHYLLSEPQYSNIRPNLIKAGGKRAFRELGGTRLSREMFFNNKLLGVVREPIGFNILKVIVCSGFMFRKMISHTNLL